MKLFFKGTGALAECIALGAGFEQGGMSSLCKQEGFCRLEGEERAHKTGIVAKCVAEISLTITKPEAFGCFALFWLHVRIDEFFVVEAISKACGFDVGPRASPMALE